MFIKCKKDDKNLYPNQFYLKVLDIYKYKNFQLKMLWKT